jgi:hypothetical protein
MLVPKNEASLIGGILEIFWEKIWVLHVVAVVVCLLHHEHVL